MAHQKQEAAGGGCPTGGNCWNHSAKVRAQTHVRVCQFSFTGFRHSSRTFNTYKRSWLFSFSSDDGCRSHLRAGGFHSQVSMVTETSVNMLLTPRSPSLSLHPALSPLEQTGIQGAIW